VGTRLERWSGRIGFIAAAAGSAVGLGSVWKFPYEVGTNGGGAFVLFYLIGLAAVVAPLMVAEFAIGRRGRGDAAGSIEAVAAACGASRAWGWLGLLGIVTGLLILSFYSVIGGWALAYAVETPLRGLPGATAQAADARFAALLASPWRLIAYHAAFMAVTAVIVARGVAGGIEAACKVLMPALVVLLAGLALYAAASGGLPATLRFMFRIEPQALTARAALEALGLGFFSIGVGLGLMVTYAAYAGESIDLRRAAVATVVADTAISFLAGFAVFPLVFAHGLDPASGAGLVFVTLPIAFARMPFGIVPATLFFVLLVFAALASAISMLELAASLFTRRLGWSRRRAALVPAVACFAGGLVTVLSFNRWADWHPLGFVPALASATPFDLLDQLTSNVLLPLGGLGLAVLAGWVLPLSLLADELRLPPKRARLLRGLLRWVVPAGILAAALAPLLLPHRPA
jgi:NSS family neurotransmitter:Na+ symporter